jgi:SAM-dependent methyltransferase
MSESPFGFVGEVPRHYDACLGPVVFAGFAEDLARRATAGAPARVLETAAGTGIVTRALRDVLPASATLVATDLNAAMLAVARAKFRADEAVSFQPADARTFDLVVCQFGLMFFPDKPASFREAARVLAPGGHYLFSVWDAHEHNPFARVVHALAERSFPGDPPAFYRVPFGCHAIDPLKAELLAAGFRDIRIAVLRLERRGTDLAAFARGLVYGNVLHEQIAARGGDPARFNDALERELRRALPEGTIALQAIVFEAVRA